MWLQHGTTRTRAERVTLHGPDVEFVEPGGSTKAENFSFTAAGAKSVLGDSVAYALGKSAAFPNELGPVVILVDVPEEVIRMAVVEHLALFGDMIDYNPLDGIDVLISLCGGVVQFDPGEALTCLMLEWKDYSKEIRGVS